MPYSSGTFSRVHDFTDDRDNGVRIQASRMDAEMDGIATGLSTALLKDGTQTATAKIPFAVGLSVIDNQTILLGTNSDIAIQYDETTNDSLEIAANVEGAALGIVLKSDQGDDNADQHKLSIADGGTLTLGSKISGSFVSYLTHTPNSTVASSTLAVAGNLTVGGNLTLGSGAELSEAELEMLDGITAGTVSPSKAVVVDANKDITSFRNVTLTGELDAGSLDILGAADIDGTLNVQGEVTFQTHLNMGDDDTIKLGDAADLQLYHDGSNSYVKDTGTGGLFIEGSAVSIRNANGTEAMASFTPDGAVSLYHDNNVKLATSSTGVTITGELVSGSLDISGNADIDGTLEADAITVDGTALATVIAGTTVTTATNANHVSVADNESTNEENLIPFIEDASATGNVGLESDGDFAYNPSTGTVSATVFKGNIDAVDGDFDGTLEADAITVNGTALGEVIQDTVGAMFSSNTETGITATYQDSDGTIDLEVSASGSAADDISTGDAAVTIATSSGNITIDAQANDTDIIFKGTDNNSDITMLTLDGSSAGDATFNNSLSAPNFIKSTVGKSHIGEFTGNATTAANQVSIIRLQDCFSSTYSVYRLIGELGGDQSAEDVGNLRFLTSGTTSHDSGYYWANHGLDDSLATITASAANEAEFQWSKNLASTVSVHVDMHIYFGGIFSRIGILGRCTYHDQGSDRGFMDFGGVSEGITSATGIEFFCSDGGNIAGYNFSVYGYRTQQGATGKMVGSYS